MKTFRLPDDRILNIPTDPNQRKIVADAINQVYGAEYPNLAQEYMEGTTLGRIVEFGKNIPRSTATSTISGIRGIFDAAAQDSLGLDGPFVQARDKLKQIEENVYANVGGAQDPRYADDFIPKAGGALGSIVPYALLGRFGASRPGAFAPYATPGSTGIKKLLPSKEFLKTPTFQYPAALGIGQSISDVSDKMRIAEDVYGEDIGLVQETLGTLTGGLIGSSEALPIFNFFKNIPKSALRDATTSQKIANYARTFGTGAVQEGLQEATAGLARDLTAKGFFSNELPIGDSVWDDLTLGGFAGGVLNTVMNYAAGRRGIASEYRAEKEKRAEKNKQDALRTKKFDIAKQSGNIDIIDPTLESEQLQETLLLPYLSDIPKPVEITTRPELQIINNPNNTFTLRDLTAVGRNDVGEIQTFSKEADALVAKQKILDEFDIKNQTQIINNDLYALGLNNSSTGFTIGQTLKDADTTTVDLKEIVTNDSSLKDAQAMQNVLMGKNKKYKSLPIQENYTFAEAKKILSKKDFDTFASETAKQVAKVAEENGYKPVIDKTKPNVTIKKLKEVAESKNIDLDINSPAFQYASQMYTGTNKFQAMSKGQKELLLARLQSLPRFNQKLKFPDFRPRDYSAEDVSEFVSNIKTNNMTFNKKSLKQINKNEQFLDDLIYSGRAERIGTSQNYKIRDNFEQDIAARTEGFDENIAEFNNRLNTDSVLPPEEVAKLTEEETITQSKPLSPEEQNKQTINFAEAVQEGKLNKFAKELKNRLNKLGLKETGVVVSNDILSSETLVEQQDGSIAYDPTRAPAEGEYDRNTDIIFLSLNNINPDGKATDAEIQQRLNAVLDHELIHALREKDLINEKEYDYLRKQAKKIRVPKAFDAESFAKKETFYQRAERINKVTFEERAGRGIIDSTPAKNELYAEEAIAEMYRARGFRSPLPPRAEGIYNKIVEFFKELGNSALISGYSNTNEIFTEIEAGKIGARERGKIRTTKLLDKGPSPFVIDQELEDTPTFARGPRDESSGHVADYVPAQYGPPAHALNLIQASDAAPEGFNVVSRPFTYPYRGQDIQSARQEFMQYSTARTPQEQQEEREFINKLMEIKGNPNAIITMYQAAPSRDLREGDIITPFLSDAQYYVDESKVTPEEVRAADRARRRQEQIDKTGAVDLNQERLFNQMDSIMDVLGTPQTTPSTIHTYELRAADVRWDGNNGWARWGYFPRIKAVEDVPTFSREADQAYFDRERKNRRISSLESSIYYKEAQLNQERGRMTDATARRLEREIQQQKNEIAELRAGDIPTFSRATSTPIATDIENKPSVGRLKNKFSIGEDGRIYEGKVERKIQYDKNNNILEDVDGNLILKNELVKNDISPDIGVRAGDFGETTSIKGGYFINSNGIEDKNYPSIIGTLRDGWVFQIVSEEAVGGYKNKFAFFLNKPDETGWDVDYTPAEVYEYYKKEVPYTYQNMGNFKSADNYKDALINISYISKLIQDSTIFSDLPTFSRASTATEPAYMDLTRADISEFTSFDEYRNIQGEKIPNAFVMRMPIDVYLKLTTPNQDSINKIKNEVIEGYPKVGYQFGKFDPSQVDDQRYPIYLDINSIGKVISHEGRHRAALLQLENAQTIPVVIRLKEEPIFDDKPMSSIKSINDLGIFTLGNQYKGSKLEEDYIKKNLLVNTNYSFNLTGQDIAMVRRFVKEDINNAVRIANAPDIQADIPTFSRTNLTPQDNEVPFDWASNNRFAVGAIIDQLEMSREPGGNRDNPAPLKMAIVEAFKGRNNRPLLRASKKFLEKFTNKKGNLVLFRALNIPEGEKIKNYGQLPEDLFASTTLDSRQALKIGRNLFNRRRQAGETWYPEILRYEVPMSKVKGYVPMLLKVMESDYINMLEDSYAGSGIMSQDEINLLQEQYDEIYYQIEDLKNELEATESDISRKKLEEEIDRLETELNNLYVGYGEPRSEKSREEYFEDDMYQYEQYMGEAEVLADLRGIKPTYQYSPEIKNRQASLINDVPLFSRGRRDATSNNTQENIQLREAVKEAEKLAENTARGGIPTYNTNASDTALKAALDFNKDLSSKDLGDIPTFSRPGFDGVDASIVEGINRTGSKTSPKNSMGYRFIDEVKDNISPRLKYFFNNFRTQFVDKLDKIDQLIIKASEENEQVRRANNTADTATIAALRMADKARGLFQGMLTKGYIDSVIEGVPALSNTKALKISTRYNQFLEGNVNTGGLMQILAPLYNSQVDKESIFKYYAMAKRTQGFDKRGRVVKSPIKEKDIQNIKKIEQQYPEVVEAYNNYQLWNNKLIEFATKKGILSNTRSTNELAEDISKITKEDVKELEKLSYDDLMNRVLEINKKLPLQQKIETRGTAQIWQENSDYYPFYKKMSDESTAGPRIASGALPNNPLDIKLTGSEEAVDVDVIEAISRNSLSILTAALKNDGVSKLIRDLQSLDMAKPITPEQAGKADSIFVFENGIKKHYQVESIETFEALTAIGGTPTGFWTTLVGAPAGLLRDTVTRDPGFVAINILRDTMSTMVTSGANYTPVIDSVKNMFADMHELERFGVLGGYDFANDEGSVKRYLKRTMRQQGMTEQNGMSASGAFFKVWDMLGALTTKSDGATRLAVYNAVYDKLISEGATQAQAQSEAAYQALEVINFGRRGLNPGFRFITAAIPFLNARVQGLDVLWRSSTGRYSAVEKLGDNQTLKDVQRKIQTNMLTNAFTLIGITLAYYLMYHDDEEYKNLKREVRDDNWVLPIFKDYAVKIPIPFEVGLLFKVIPERVFDMTLGDDRFTKKSANEAKESIIRGAQTSLNIPFFQPGGGFQILKPISEAINNKNTFTGTEIVPYYQQKKEPGLQSRPTTNYLIKSIGEFLNISPSKVEHVVRGYTGSLGAHVLNVVDMTARRVTGEPILPSNVSLNKIPFFNRLLTDIDKSGGYQQQFYELRNEVDRAVQTMNALEKAGRYDELLAYRSNIRGLLDIKNEARRIDRYLTKWRLRRDAIMNNPNMSVSAKSDAIRELELERDKRLAFVPEMRKRADIPFINMNIF